MAEQTIDGLVGKVAAGDRLAFEHLYRALADTAYLVAHATLQDSAQAEEVVQEVFLEIWRGAQRYEPDRGSALRWVRTIARNRAIDRVRAAQAARARDRLVLAKPDEEVDPEEVVIERLAYRRLTQAMRLLSVDHRAVLVLTYFGDLSHGEVATALGIPLGTVKSRLSAAVRHLRRIVDSDISGDLPRG